MRVEVQQNNDGSWRVTPLSGKFRGVCIAHADQIALGAPFEFGNLTSGELVSVWGLNILRQDVYDDELTVIGLCIGKPFGLTATIRDFRIVQMDLELG